MGNEQVQPQKERSSRIKFGIHRTLSTGAFETIVIHYEIDEEIAWPNTKEGLLVRRNKVLNWEKVLLDEFKGAHDRILDELGLSHKKAYFKNKNSSVVPPPAIPAPAVNKEQKNSPEPDSDLDSLDSLDELE